MSLITGVTGIGEEEEALAAAARSPDRAGSGQDSDSFIQLQSAHLSVSADFFRVISFPLNKFSDDSLTDKEVHVRRY